MKILEVFVEPLDDPTAQSDYLGSYVDVWSEGCIDRQAMGDWNRNEYRYWKPGPNHFPHRPESWSHVTADEISGAFERLPAKIKARRHEFPTVPALLDHFYVLEDYRRCEALNNGDWNYIGIIAKAKVVGMGGVVQTLRSGGLWGIESDSDEDYIRQVEDEELKSLAEILKGFGFGALAVTRAVTLARRSCEGVRA
jgi:hypothetical protein